MVSWSHLGIKHIPVKATVARFNKRIQVAVVYHGSPTLVAADETELSIPENLLDKCPSLTAIRGPVYLATQGKAVQRAKEIQAFPH